ncbi:hypothetical protein AYO20_09442 [Fonsecaea nubica]|uniref:Zn(2)-C6 fungal-type domain-containing protein n=1 Tax=Fonsecaea nubica TaxID=856822 RepID=A0A178CGM7_9EURO|nr:hypothetical protein AYO20_09442 [Fonsecaea nubica]OAL28494.1 hypothetical protein AYO20_09442 [Fonsecaea nubica]
MANGQRGDQGKGVARACEFCRWRKIRCDNPRPSCGSCLTHRRDCVYRFHTRKERATNVALNALRAENQQLVNIIRRLKTAAPDQTVALLESIAISRDDKNLLDSDNESTQVSSDNELDVSTFFSVDEQGEFSTFGPSSALQLSHRHHEPVSPLSVEHLRNALITNAALSATARVRDLSNGRPGRGADRSRDASARSALEPAASHVPADAPTGGDARYLIRATVYIQVPPECNLCHVPASSPSVSRCEMTPRIMPPAGGRFFRRCDDLLMQDSLLNKPSIPTIVGLPLLGSTFNAKGQTSRGRLYTGYALRMVYDVGLHVDRTRTPQNAEEIELRRRVFWGAFVCDKFQSLYIVPFSE